MSVTVGPALTPEQLVEHRIEIYKQAAALIMTKSYAVHEMQMLANVTNYLAQEIQANEPAETSTDSGTESEAPVL